MFKKMWKWIVGAFAFIGAIIVYVLLNKDDAQKRVDKIESEIKEINKNIKAKEKERKKVLATADEHATESVEIDKKIKKAKAKKENLDNKREKMKAIFDKYGV